MKKLTVIVVLTALVAVLLTAMARSVPSKSLHYEAVKVGLIDIVNKEIAAKPELEPYADMGRSVVMNMLDDVLDKKMEVRESRFYSVGLVMYKGEQVPVSVGVLGRVYLTVGSEELEKLAKSQEIFQKVTIDDVQQVIKKVEESGILEKLMK